MSTSICKCVVLGARYHLQWISTGLCPFSPPLHSVYRWLQKEPREHLLNFADDSALLSLLQRTQDGHGAALDDLIDWCDDTYLDLHVGKLVSWCFEPSQRPNVGKTKEIIFDLRRPRHAHVAVHEEIVEIINSYTTFEDTFHWDLTIEPSQRKGVSDSTCCGSSILFSFFFELMQLCLTVTSWHYCRQFHVSESIIWTTAAYSLNFNPAQTDWPLSSRKMNDLSYHTNKKIIDQHTKQL